MESKQIVVFKLLEHEFGMDIIKVLEIQNYESIRPVPEVPDYIEGIINVRGVVFTILNLPKRLNLPLQENLSHSKLILMNLKDNRVGFIVDSVSEILTVETMHIEESSTILGKKEVSCIQGIIKKADQMILLLDVDILISETQEMMPLGVNDENNYSSNSK